MRTRSLIFLLALIGLTSCSNPSSNLTSNLDDKKAFFAPTVVATGSSFGGIVEDDGQGGIISTYGHFVYFYENSGKRVDFRDAGAVIIDIKSQSNRVLVLTTRDLQEYKLGVGLRQLHAFDLFEKPLGLMGNQAIFLRTGAVWA